MSAAQWEQGREWPSKNVGLGERHHMQSPVGCCKDSSFYFVYDGYHLPMPSCIMLSDLPSRRHILTVPLTVKKRGSARSSVGKVLA